MKHLMDWLPWLAGGGIITAVAVVVLAPSVATVLASYLVALSPLLKGAAEGIVAFVSEVLWPGVKDILDSYATVMCVVLLMLGSGFWGMYHEKSGYHPVASASCTVSRDRILHDLRKEFKFVPRK